MGEEIHVVFVIIATTVFPYFASLFFLAWVLATSVQQKSTAEGILAIAFFVVWIYVTQSWGFLLALVAFPLLTAKRKE